jgi:hypothetical protein
MYKAVQGFKNRTLNKRCMWRRLFFCPNKKPDDYINVTIELDDVDITSAETKATYDEIKRVQLWRH